MTTKITIADGRIIAAMQTDITHSYSKLQNMITALKSINLEGYDNAKRLLVIEKFENAMDKIESAGKHLSDIPIPLGAAYNE